MSAVMASKWVYAKRMEREAVEATKTAQEYQEKMRRNVADLDNLLGGTLVSSVPRLFRVSPKEAVLVRRILYGGISIDLVEIE